MSRVTGNLLSAILFLCFFLAGNSSPAQLSVNKSHTPKELVESILKGKGIEVENVSFNGAPLSIGYFNGQATNIGLKSGVLLTTGSIYNAIGPNSEKDKSTENKTPGDPILDQLSKGITEDAAILEFDFIPSADSVGFNYVFASEEYDEYVCSEFNDVFGFFISGPGITGTKNIALIPGTSTPVAINTVNRGNPGANSSSFATCILSNLKHYVHNEHPLGQTVEYDGFTRVLTAWSRVIPCERYHIKIAIADAGDAIYDSGVFLEEGSLSSTDIELSAKSNVRINNADTILAEGCGAGKFIFKRSGSVQNGLSIRYQMSGTANEGSDYNEITDSIFIPAGQRYGEVEIQALFDEITEGNETITMTILRDKPCTEVLPPSATFLVIDNSPISIKAYNDTLLLCPGTPAKLKAVVSGGVESTGYGIMWNNGAGSGEIVKPRPMKSTTYTASVTDVCGDSAKDSVRVTVQYEPLLLSATEDMSICLGDTIDLRALASGGRGNYWFEWSTGESTSNIRVFPEGSETYTVSVYDSCRTRLSREIVITSLSPKAKFDYEYITNSKLKFINQSSGGQIVHWDFGDGSYSKDQQPTHQFYEENDNQPVQLVIVNEHACMDSAMVFLKIFPDFRFYSPNAFSPNYDLVNDQFFGEGVGFISYKMVIFDRWGNDIFSSNHIRNRWDGTIHGEPAPEGVYVFMFELEEPNGSTHQYTGHVTLIR